MLIPARLLALLGLSLAIGAVGLALVWNPQRAAGVFALEPRAPPGPACHLVVEVDRESVEGVAVQFGELQCPFRGREPALRVGAAWFALPDRERGSKYDTVRRTPDDRHWLVAGDTDLFRSDDGGRSFSQLRPPGWRSTSRVGSVKATGPRLEELSVSIETDLPLIEQVFEAAKADPDDDTWVAQRAHRLKLVWAMRGGRHGPGSVTQGVSSDDGGRSWARRIERAGLPGGSGGL